MQNRHSIRLRKYDYSLPGSYFVTICTQNKKCLFGNVIDGKMILNDTGKMVQMIWNEIPQYYLGINIDQFQIMPNHIHGIIVITTEPYVGADPCVCPGIGANPVGADPRVCPKNNGQTQGSVIGQTQGSAPTVMASVGLSVIVQRFKSLTTKRYIGGVKYNNWPPFFIRLWQRNYYERVIRDEIELMKIRQYIMNNPDKWQNDNCYDAFGSG